MKILIDDKIPFIRGVFEPVADVVYKAGAQISHADLLDADALITRTRTRCNAENLSGTKIKFIASATIGFDHIDTDFCKKNSIVWTNAAGCNSTSVQQYVLAALLQYAQKCNTNLQGKKIGIVGVGHVGSKIADICSKLGMELLLCDAPRKKLENGNFVNINELAQNADVITFHVPLNRGGEHNTYHLFDQAFAEKLQAKVVINTSRGEVIETDALKMLLQNKKLDFSIIDVWENEPQIDRTLLSLVNIATPHIAGYSTDGKAVGTTMSVRALSRFFNLGLDNWMVTDIPLTKTEIEIDGTNKSDLQLLNSAVVQAYNINTDDAALRANAQNFEKLRSDYRIRRECAVYKVLAKHITQSQQKMLSLFFNDVKIVK